MIPKSNDRSLEKTPPPHSPSFPPGFFCQESSLLPMWLRSNILHPFFLSFGPRTQNPPGLSTHLNQRLFWLCTLTTFFSCPPVFHDFLCHSFFQFPSCLVAKTSPCGAGHPKSLCKRPINTINWPPPRTCTLYFFPALIVCSKNSGNPVPFFLSRSKGPPPKIRTSWIPNAIKICADDNARNVPSYGRGPHVGHNTLRLRAKNSPTAGFVRGPV